MCMFETITILCYYMQYVLYTETRARLSGMLITGSSSEAGSEVVLFHDTSNIENCSGKYTDTNKIVCLDTIDITVSNNELLQYVKISTTDYLMLCEVEVYAGNETLACLFCLHNQVYIKV